VLQDVTALPPKLSDLACTEFTSIKKDNVVSTYYAHAGTKITPKKRGFVDYYKKEYSPCAGEDGLHRVHTYKKEVVSTHARG